MGEKPSQWGKKKKKRPLELSHEKRTQFRFFGLPIVMHDPIVNIWILFVIEVAFGGASSEAKSTYSSSLRQNCVW